MLYPTLSSLCSVCLVLSLGLAKGRAEEPQPIATDDQLMVELFAEHPRIVTPTGIAVDPRGRVFVVESHTHFRPDDYQGPKTDRILIFEDTDGDGAADHRRVFHEGFTYVMDLEFHHDGSLYVATRMDIHRLRDTDGDDVADEVTPIVVMETTGTYPHNGLSGLAFEFDGTLNFGLGENLGHDYTLIGTDGTRLSGGGEGGSTYRVKADGTGLQRVSTGWWNPFGMCVDAYGRVFGTDNDPGASPPCRLIQVIKGGDYGYEYRYGRTGLHPLITWTGDLPGTLPMISGTGEAPCAVLAYESNAFPAEYRGDLLLATWADHQIERYRLTQPDQSGLVVAQREILVKGPNEFRPVGLATGPDGTIYFTDWVSSSYTLHGLGRIWRIRPKKLVEASRPTDPKQALLSTDQPTRESAARKLVQSPEGRAYLKERLHQSRDPRVQMLALQALATVPQAKVNYRAIVKNATHPGVRAFALRQLVEGGTTPREWAARGQPQSLRVEALMGLDPQGNWDMIRTALDDDDPAVVHAAIEALAKGIDQSSKEMTQLQHDHELAWLLAAKRNPRARRTYADKLHPFLQSADPAVRLMAVKWIADDRLAGYRADLEKLLNARNLNLRLFLATSAALDRLDGKDPQDQPPPARLLQQIRDDSAPVAIRQYALRLIEPTSKVLRVDDLNPLLDHANRELRVDAIRTLAAMESPKGYQILIKLVQDSRQSTEIRAEAVAGLAPVAMNHAELLLRLAHGDESSLQEGSLRALTGLELNVAQQQQLCKLAQTQPELKELIARVLTGSPGNRPHSDDLDAWMKLLTGKGDPEAGERLFFGTKVGTCAKCHRVEGRGQAVGPDLSVMKQRMESLPNPRRWLLETILQPSKDMAPEYTPWTIITDDGKTHTGLPRRKGGGAEAYLGIDGKEFVLKKAHIEYHQESRTSIMPEGLLQALTRRELNDLFAWLER